MTDSYCSTISPSDAAAWLGDAETIAITTHYKADGDAIGSSLALARALALARGDAPRPELWYGGPLPDFAPPILRPDAPRHLDSSPVGADDRPGALVIVDTGAWSQLEFVRSAAEGRAESTLIIDHHLRGDADIADRRLIDTSAPAAAQIVGGVCTCLLGVGASSLPVEVATPLYLGIATDTGWFRHSNVTPGMFRLVGDLLEAGATHTELYRLIEQRDRVSRLRLYARALDTLELFDRDRVAITMLSEDAFKASGAAPGDTGGFADRMLQVESIRVAVVLTEATDHEGKPVTKVSFRSKPGPEEVDVNRVASTLGGGGHARAAGARLPDSLTETRDAVLAALREAM